MTDDWNRRASDQEPRSDVGLRPGLQTLTDKNKGEFHKYVANTNLVTDLNRLIDEGCDAGFLLDLATSYVLFEPKTLAKKIEESTDLTMKDLKGIQKRVQAVASVIRKLNSAQLPGRTTPLRLMREFGVPSGGGLYPEYLQQNAEIVAKFEGLPDLLKLYASSALKNWPHTMYRKLATDRNWQKYHLVWLCEYVKVITGSPHWTEIANLVNALDRFVNSKMKIVVEGRSKTTKLVESTTAGKSTGAELVKKAYESFRQRNPDDWAVVHRKMEIIKDRHEEKI